MMNWLYYLLEANLYLALFYGFYRMFLHRETFYTLNRGYLIISGILAFTLPVLQIGYFYNLLGYSNTTDLTRVSVHQIQDHADLFTPQNVLTASYLIVVAVLFIRLCISLFLIIRLAVRSPKKRTGKIIMIELTNAEPAFSFFNFLFINPDASKKETILKHEMIHIRQRHSMDILFFEFLQILAWFNPVTYFLKQDIKLLHEYIADDITTNKYIRKQEYAMFLIQNSFGVIPNPLTNQIFNQSILKRRINMLNQKRSAGRARLKLLFAVPIATGMLCMSTMAFTKNYALIDLYPEKYSPVAHVPQDSIKKKVIKLKLAPPPPPAQPKPTRKLVPPPPPPVEAKHKQKLPEVTIVAPVHKSPDNEAVKNLNIQVKEPASKEIEK